MKIPAEGSSDRYTLSKSLGLVQSISCFPLPSLLKLTSLTVCLLTDTYAIRNNILLSFC
jgi:hypothetical protein